MTREEIHKLPWKAQEYINDLERKLTLTDVIKRIEGYAPKPIELTEFDLTKKADHIYCVEWGMKKAKKHEFEVYQKMLKELKEKYVL